MRFSGVLTAALAVSTVACEIGGSRGQPATSFEDPYEGQGVYPQWVSSGGYHRRYELFVPAGHDGQSPLPLVIVLHGASSSGAGIREALKMDAAAQRHGFAAVYPYGLASWAVGIGTAADRAGVDDVRFIRALIQHLAANLPIDRRRVYVVGFSDGASMSYRLGCALTGEFAAVGAISSGIPGFWQIFGAPLRPPPVLILTGTSDEIFPLAVVEATAEGWAHLDGCRESDTQQLDGLSDEGRAISHTSYDRCDAGAVVELYVVDGGHHTTAVPLRGTTLADLYLDFFGRYVRPE